MTSQFRNFDTKRADGVYVQFVRHEEHDDATSPTDFDCYSKKRIKAWRNDEWSFIGIQAKAQITIVRNGHGIMHYMTSGGLWGIESDSGEDYLNEVFDDQKAELLADLEAIGKLPLVVK